MSTEPPGTPGVAALARREYLRRRVHRYLNLPVVLAAILFVLVAFTHISGTGSLPWRRHFWHGPSVELLWLIWSFFIVEFCAKFALAPHKPTYLRRHWFDAVVALLPFCGVLRAIEVVLISPLVRLLRGEEARPHLAILVRRKLDKLALICVLVILIVACLVYIFENGAEGATINTFGEALWWAAATATTVGNQLYPVTLSGEVLAFFLMLFAIGVFSYLTSSIASALIGGDAAESGDQSAQDDRSSQTDQHEANASGQGQATPSYQAAQVQGAAVGGVDTARQGAVGARATPGADPGQRQSAQDATPATVVTQRNPHNGHVSIILSPDELQVLTTVLERARQKSA